MPSPRWSQSEDSDPLVELRRELVRLRGGRALADSGSLLRLSDGFWSIASPGRTRPKSQTEVIRTASALILAAIATLNGDLRRYTEVEFNVDKRISHPDLGERQHALAEELGYSVKTIRRRGDAAVYELALQLMEHGGGHALTPPEQKLDLAPADESEILPQAKLLKRFWGISARQRVDIVCSELPKEDQPYYASPRDKNYLRYAKFADLDSLVYVRTRLAELFPHCYIRDFSASEYFDSQVDHLIVLGGPDWNAKAGEFQEFLPIKFFWDEDKKETFVTVDGNPLYPLWSPTNALICEYAMFARFKLRHGLTVSLLSGCLTYGVLGASRCFLDPTVVGANVEFVESMIGTATFAVLMKIREFGGIVQSPDLRTDSIAAYKSDADFSGQFTRIPLGSQNAGV